MSENFKRETQTNQGARTGFLLAMLVLGVAVVGAAVFFLIKGKEPAEAPQIAQVSDETPKPRFTPKKSTAELDPVVETGEDPKPVATAPVAVVRPPGTTAPVKPKVEPSGYTRSLVSALELDFKSGPLTPEKVEAWKQSLATLKQQGAAGVPAILEYLEKNTDINFDTAGKDLGASSLRMALLESLQSVGGPEALSASLQVLQTTTDPREIAYLAASLDTQYPGQYQQEFLRAARDTLQMAAQNKLPGVDVGPLYGPLAKYGGPEAVNELEGLVGAHRYYSIISLGQLPDNAGVPSLVKMATDPNYPNKSAQGPAMQMLAQLAGQSQEARDALLNEAQKGTISYPTWMTIFDILGGKQFALGDPLVQTPGMKTWQLAGNSPQRFRLEANPNLTPQELQNLLELAQKAATKTTDQAIIDGLNQAAGELKARLGQ